MHEGGLEMGTPNVDGVDEQHVIEVHWENLQKQILAWKPHYCNSITWAFFKVNDNQFVIMGCDVLSDTTQGWVCSSVPYLSGTKNKTSFQPLLY